MYLLGTGQVVSKSSVERVKEVDKKTNEMKLKLQTFDEEVKQRLKLEDLGTDGDKPDAHWADLRNVHPDVREEFFRVYQSDEIGDVDEEPSPEISDVQFTILVSRVSCILKERHNPVVTSHVNNPPFLLASMSLYSLVTTQRAVGLINQVKIAVRTTTGTIRVVTAIQDDYYKVIVIAELG
jgi:hypothetical protein